MAVIVDLDQVKSLLPIEHTGHDVLIKDLIDRAEARLTSFIRRALIAPPSGQKRTEHFDGGVHRFRLRDFPVEETSVTVTDTMGTKATADDETYDSDLWRLDPDTGILYRTSSFARPMTWGLGIRRWKVDYRGGLNLHADWDDVIRPELESSIIDLVADWYENTNPRVTDVGEGPGISRELMTKALPPRIERVWAQYRAEWV